MVAEKTKMIKSRSAGAEEAAAAKAKTEAKKAAAEAARAKAKKAKEDAAAAAVKIAAPGETKISPSKTPRLRPLSSKAVPALMKEFQFATRCKFLV